MDLDIAWLSVSLALGCVGLGLFVYGKRQSKFLHLIAGIALMVYPYFVSNLIVMIGVGAGILGLLWFTSR